MLRKKLCTPSQLPAAKPHAARSDGAVSSHLFTPEFQSRRQLLCHRRLIRLLVLELRRVKEISSATLMANVEPARTRKRSSDDFTEDNAGPGDPAAPEDRQTFDAGGWPPTKEDARPDGLKEIGRPPKKHSLDAVASLFATKMAGQALVPRVATEERYAAEWGNAHTTMESDSPTSSLPYFSEAFFEDVPIGARSLGTRGDPGTPPSGTGIDTLRRSAFGSLPAADRQSIEELNLNNSDYVGWWKSVPPKPSGPEDPATPKSHAKQRQRVLLEVRKALEEHRTLSSKHPQDDRYTETSLNLRASSSSLSSDLVRKI